MPERKINLEEICNKYIGENNYSKYVLDTMREFGKQLLELASENAKIYTDTMCSPYSEDWVKYIDKQSILDTIKQVE